MSELHEILRSPAITEKNTALRSEKNKYVFEVQTTATKAQIRTAVEKLFGVKVVKVNTMVVKGKRKRMGRFAGWRPERKKAIVRLAEGEKIKQFGDA